MFCVFLFACSKEDDTSKESKNNSNSDVIACSEEELPDHATTAQKSRASTDESWGACEATECKTSYHLHNGVCYEPIKDCDISFLQDDRSLKQVGIGQTAYYGNGKYKPECQVTSCIGGYDSAFSYISCNKTPAGSYSEEGSKERIPCSSTPAKPNKAYASWSNRDGLVQASECEWGCARGYKKSTDSTDCEPAESVNSFEITNLTGLGSGQKGTNNLSLELSITATNVSKWKVTHDSSFRADSKTDTSSWSGSQPTSYLLPSNVSDGKYRLYLWVAGLDGKVKTPRQTSQTFTLDRAAPVIAISSKPLAQDSSASASFELSTTDTIKGAGLDHFYCANLLCDPIIKINSFPLSISTSSVGTFYIKFKVADKLGHSSTIDYTWSRTTCVTGAVEAVAPIISNGLARKRTCQGDGSFGPITVENCRAGYVKKVNSCSNPKQGFYVDASKSEAACGDAPTNGEWVLRQPASVTSASACKFTCTGSYHFESGADCVSNTEDCSDDIADGTGEKTWNSAANGGRGAWSSCQPVSCSSGYVKTNGCGNPQQGFYADDSGNEAACGDAPANGEWVLRQPESVTSASACQFTCTGSYHINSGKTDCVSSTKACVVAQGTGEKTWDPALNSDAGGWPVLCEIKACVGGFDSTQNPTTQCQKTALEYYSEAGNKDRKSCTGKSTNNAQWIVNSSIPSTRGAKSLAECKWECDSKYIKTGSQCYQTEMACIGSDLPSHATVAKKTRPLSGDWGICKATSCELNYHPYNGVCYEPTQACSITEVANGVTEQIGTGQKPYSSNGQYQSQCQITSCIAGYDSVEDSSVCAPTVKGFFLDFYSPASDKGRHACSSTPAKPVVGASWVGTGLGASSECSWECSDAYTQKNSDKDSCVALEKITVFEIVNLKTISDNQKAINSKTFSLRITGTNIDKWYVTHAGTNTFRPLYSTQTEGGRSWSTSPPTSYTVTEDGLYDLHLWVADAGGSVKEFGKEISGFRVDTTKPTLRFTRTPSSTSTDATFEIYATDPTRVALSYCMDSLCSNTGTGTGTGTSTATYTPFSSKRGLRDNYDIGTLSLPGLSLGQHQITVKGVDELGHTESVNHTWTISAPPQDTPQTPVAAVCPAGDKEAEDIEHGTQERICGNDGQWEAWGVKTCDAGYDNHVNNNECATTQGGFYSPAGQKDRSSCSPNKPTYSSWIHTGIGLAIDSCRWSCNSPYVKDAESCILGQGGLKKVSCSVLDMTNILSKLPDRCSETRFPGDGLRREFVPRYYFESSTGLCKIYAPRIIKPIDYANSNKNIFISFEQCMNTCAISVQDLNTYSIAKGFQTEEVNFYHFKECHIRSCLGGKFLSSIKTSCISACPIGEKVSADGTACVLADFNLDEPVLVNASNASTYNLSGACSLDSEVEVIIGENASQSETEKVSCVNAEWTLSFDLSSFRVSRIPYVVQYKDRNNRTKKLVGKLKMDSLLTNKDKIIWNNPIYTPATITWKKAYLDLQCEFGDGNGIGKKRNPITYLRSLSVLTSSNHYLGNFFYRYTKDTDGDGIIDDGDSNFVSILLDYYSNLPPLHRDSDDNEKIKSNLKRVLKSREGATKRFGIQFDENGDITFTAPKNTGENWNGRKIRVTTHTAPDACANTEGRANQSWRNFILTQISLDDSDYVEVDVNKHATFSGGETRYKTATFTIDSCLSSSGSDRSITIDGVQINLGGIGRRTPTQMARRIANTDFSSGTAYSTNNYTVSANGNEVTFTLSAETQAPPLISISDSTYEEEQADDCL